MVISRIDNPAVTHSLPARRSDSRRQARGVEVKIRLSFLLAGLLMHASAAALAEQPYVEIEQRLTVEQLHATGLDTLSPQQLELLNRLLRERARVKTVEAAVAESAREQAAEVVCRPR